MPSLVIMILWLETEVRNLVLSWLHFLLTLSLPQAIIIGFCKQHNEPSHLDLRCLTFTLSTLHINFFPSFQTIVSYKKKKKKEQMANVVWNLAKSCNIRKRTLEHVLSLKIQINLRIPAAWSESSLGLFWIAKDANFLLTKILIRLCEYAGWFESSLGVHVTRVLQKVLSLGSDYFSATFYQTYFYYKPSKYSPFTETHFCNLFTQSRKADK